MKEDESTDRGRGRIYPRKASGGNQGREDEENEGGNQRDSKPAQ